MLESAQSSQTNQRFACLVAGAVAAVSLGASWALNPVWLVGLLLAGIVYWWLRRSVQRRLHVMAQPMPSKIQATLDQHVAFYQALDEPGKERFGNLVKVFLDETPITGIRTDVDPGTRALVAASAIIPIFGFDDWEYAGLGEVLIYPDAFGEDYSTSDGIGGGGSGGDGGGDGTVERRTLGMIGVGHLSGVMILSKPDLWSGFKIANDKRNVGIHEFAHLVDKADGTVDGLPPGVTMDTAGPWIQWVGQELKSEPEGANHIDDYAYTNEAEYFAVLSEYFFEAPATLQKKAPKTYAMMQKMYRQDTSKLLPPRRRKRRRVGRNSKCPCGSGEKFKRCCGHPSKRT